MSDKKAIQPAPVPVHPIEASADGKRNAFAFECDILKTRQHFASCLNHITNRQRGPLKRMFKTCCEAIDDVACPAIQMRAQEREKGQAIFFVERIRSGDTLAKASAFFKGDTQPPADQPIVVGETAKHRLGTGNYADAINRALAQPKGPTTDEKRSQIAVAGVNAAGVVGPIAVVNVKIEALPGESLLAVARRTLLQAKEKQS